MIVHNYDADLEVSDTCVRSSLLSCCCYTPRYTCIARVNSENRWVNSVNINCRLLNTRTADLQSLDATLGIGGSEEKEEDKRHDLEAMNIL